MLESSFSFFVLGGSLICCIILNCYYFLEHSYRCVTLNSLRGLDLEPDKWNLRVNKQVAEHNYALLMKEAEAVSLFLRCVELFPVLV